MIYPIRCAHCMATFSHDEVHFRASHYKEWQKDSKKKKREESGKKKKKLSQYNKRIQRELDPKLPRAIDPNSATIQKIFDEDDMLLSIFDEFNECSVQRLCPYCHNDIPEFSGHYPHYIIALIGETSVGKTVYMAALAATLFPGDARSNHVGLSIRPAEIKTQHWYKQTYTKMFEKRILPSSTQRERVEPVHLKVGDNAVVSIYDAAGEGIRRLEDRRSYLNHCKSSE